ncbi:hypothetical protein EPL73_21210, partial [Clostridioides difficile]|nr:hypothetical protein [Clostridioides difficile]
LWRSPVQQGLPYSRGHLNRSCRLRCRMKFPVCSPVHAGAQRYLREDQLLPMLHSRDKEPTPAGLMLDAEELTSAYILPRKDGERLYLDLFAKGEYRPELLFGECAIAQAAVASPEAQWKLANLKKMKR